MVKKEKLNIVQIFYARPHLGGSGISSTRLSKELAKNGHNVNIVSYPGTYLTEEEKSIGLKIHPIDRIDYPCFKAEPYNATLASQIFNLYKSGMDIDIIHANYAITHGDAALMARDMTKNIGGHAKVVITNRGSDIHTNGHHKLLAPYLEHILNSADQITFNSQALQDEAKNLFNLKSYGSVIYNPIDGYMFSPVSKEEKFISKQQLGLPKDSVVIYHASNFRPIKQVNLIIESAKILKERNENIYFLLVGDGVEKASLEEKAKFEYNLDNIIFTGKQEDVLPYINASDVAILPSSREAFGMSLVEPMSCGLPAIGTNVGGIPEIIKHDFNGYLFDNGDIDQIVHYITKISKDDSLRAKLGNSAREFVTTKFAKDKIVESYENMYYDLLGI